MLQRTKYNKSDEYIKYKSNSNISYQPSKYHHKKKSSIFKSEDLHISNTDIVHIKKDDYSPINPNVVDIENKRNNFCYKTFRFIKN